MASKETHWCLEFSVGTVSIEGANETGSIVCACGNTGIAVEDMIHSQFLDIEHTVKRWNTVNAE